jgi:hypothetical protein
MRYKTIAIITAIVLFVGLWLATADVLPQPVPENQVFTTSSIIEAVGITTESHSLVWEIGDAGLTALADPRWHPDDDLTKPVDQWRVLSGSIAYVTYSDTIATNGGQISEVKSFALDTREKTSGLFNVETSKVLTYTGQNGSHLMGAESYVLDVAGNWRRGLDNVVCVFAQAKNEIIPAFCNKVTASSKLSSVTTAQVETVGQMTAVSEKESTPAALKYQISVTPDANSSSGYADGIVSTTFTVSVMEGKNAAETPATYKWECTGNPSEGDDCGSVPTPPPTQLGQTTEGESKCGESGNEVPCSWESIIDSTGALTTLANYSELASTVTVIDSATVAGGISTFNKVFDYRSGYKCADC